MLPIFKSREDKLRPYLEPLLKDMLFTEIPGDYLVGQTDLSFMEKVPFPVKKDELLALKDSGLSAVQIADNIALVIGANTGFKHADAYLQFLNKLFDDKLVGVFAGKAREDLSNGNFRRGLAYLRAAMMFRDDSLEAMFSYASGCRYWYTQLEGSEEDIELIGILKAEANEYFEHTTDKYPEYAGGWYFLGYAYLNDGQYLRAQIAWKKYLDAADRSDVSEAESIMEIEERLAALDDPVKIEQGVMLLNSGRVMEGLKILEPYVQTEYSNWWPLHFYLGCAYEELGELPEAIEGFLNVLKLSPSNIDAMEALADLYSRTGDTEKFEKYANKAALIKAQNAPPDEVLH